MFQRFPRSLFRLLTQYCAIALLLTAGIQSATAEETRWYDVEVIIFNQKSKQYRASETWPVDIALPDMANTRTLSSGGRGAFSLLRKNELKLNSEAARIEAAPELEMLLHMGWRQPGLSQERAISIPVYDGMLDGARYRKPGSTAQPHRLEGTLKLVLSRYLHIYTDLLYREAAGNNDIAAASSAQETIGDPTSTAAAYKVYRMQQSRRMRSKELHYLDHPVLGMVIRVTPLATGG